MRTAGDVGGRHGGLRRRAELELAAMVVDVMDADAHGCSLGDAGARGDGHARGGGRKGGGQREYGGAFGYERGV